MTTPKSAKGEVQAVAWQMPLNEALAKAAEYDERHKDVPSVSRTLLAAYQAALAARDAAEQRFTTARQNLRQAIRTRNHAERERDRLREALTQARSSVSALYYALSGVNPMGELEWMRDECKQLRLAIDKAMQGEGS